ncbi:hypothetical protein GGS20DRAFT_494331 [Poronia punctata]|nr:hypothetical protein GGS20DRAFT_494331 [Poronia punctata]
MNGTGLFSNLGMGIVCICIPGGRSVVSCCILTSTQPKIGRIYYGSEIRLTCSVKPEGPSHLIPGTPDIATHT